MGRSAMAPIDGSFIHAVVTRTYWANSSLLSSTSPVMSSRGLMVPETPSLEGNTLSQKLTNTQDCKIDW